MLVVIGVLINIGMVNLYNEEVTMAEWVNELYIKDLWENTKEGTMTISELGKAISKRIRTDILGSRIRPIYMKEEIDDIAYDFEHVTDDVEEFDMIMERLYDWADTPLDGRVGGKKMCWIRTF